MARYTPELITEHTSSGPELTEHTSSGPRGLGLRNPLKGQYGNAARVRTTQESFRKEAV